MTVVFISLYLDGDHAPDDQIAEEDHETAYRDQDPADDAAEHRPEVGRGHEVHECREHDRQEGDQGARRSGLRGQGRDLTLDAHALADRVGDVVEDLGQVSTDGAVDGVRGRDQVEVLRHNTLGDVGE